ncbi:MAG: cation diffusion facilitator family transporter [Bdellovibrionales bacterium]
MGIILNLLFVIIEFYYGFKIDSLALMADASHNLSDVAGLLLGWIGLTLSRKKGNFKFSYGWKKASLFAAFINSTLILVGMGSLSWEALGRFQSQDQNPEPITIMIVAGVGLLINSFTAYLFFKGSKADLNIRGAFLHMTADAVVSLGVLVAGFLTLKFGFSWIDPVTSLIIAFVITIGSFRLFKQSLHLLMDGVPDSIDYESVKKYLMAKPGVTDVFDLHIWSLSSTDIALTAHLQMPGGCPGDFFLLEIKKELTDNFHIHHTTIQITRSFSLANSCIQT